MLDNICQKKYKKKLISKVTFEMAPEPTLQHSGPKE